MPSFTDYCEQREADRTARRIERSRSIAERELRFRYALQGRTPTPAELQAAADAAEERDRQRDAATAD